jgi:hypothetical protein
MKLHEFNAIIKSVGKEEKFGETSTKQTVLVEIPARKYSDQWGEEKEIRAEFFECDIVNRKIEPKVLEGLIGKKVVVKQAWLNGYEYKEKDASGKETGNTKYGKSITINQMAEWRG